LQTFIGSGPAVTTKGSASRGGRNAHEGSTDIRLPKSASVEQQKGSPYSKKSSSNRPPLKKSEKLTENGRPGAGCSKVNGKAKGNKPDVIELSSEDDDDDDDDEDEEGSVADSVASGYNESQDESEEVEESEDEDEQQKRTPGRRKKTAADSADLSAAGKKVAKKTPEKGRSASAKSDSKPSSKTSKVCLCLCLCLCLCVCICTLCECVCVHIYICICIYIYIYTYIHTYRSIYYAYTRARRER
jgi:hypothetical protein